MSTGWYLAQLKPNALGIAERNLQRQGFETFMPKLRETRRGAKFAERVVALFPGYLFIGVSARSRDVGVIRSTRGVAHIVRSAGKVTPLPHAVIEALASQCDENDIYTPHSDLSAGDRVTVTNGPFAEYFGKIHDLSAEGRVWVLLDVMGQGVVTEMQRRDVQSVR